MSLRRFSTLFVFILVIVVAVFGQSRSGGRSRGSSQGRTGISDARRYPISTRYAYSRHDFYFSSLATTWDEGLPFGNGMLGALLWKKDSLLRMALDRADLWDLRTVKEFERPEFRFSWVVDQARKKDYKPVQQLFDVPYDRDAAPTKLPGAALEFPIPDVEKVVSAELLLEHALGIIRWRNGIKLNTFVHATEPRGWFRLEGFKSGIRPCITPPPYGAPDTLQNSGNSGPGGNDLRRLGYPAPVIRQKENEILYHQECSGGFSYDVWVGWRLLDSTTMIGCWTIRPSKQYLPGKREAPITLNDITEKRYQDELKSHIAWWNNFWSQSSVRLPDLVLEKQWYREMYKFGSASRRGAPPITLQAVWTADNMRLPPWKGDFHNDLNTQLSYWPAYSSNHLEEESAFLDWLWSTRENARRYTKAYFQVDGLNYPGVSTLTGEPMGGWIQYSLGPTVSAWLAHHFYLHWRYNMDREFLKAKAYPWIRDVAIFLDQLSVRESNGKRKLPLSSSPEINDNDVTAWFDQTTNFDLALIRWLYSTAAELAHELGNEQESRRWRSILDEWPNLALSATDKKILVAPGEELKASHRHFSHLMAIHPLGIIDISKGENDRQIINASLMDLERLGTDWWCGYSYAWLGNLWARARQGDKAADALRIFSQCFCLPNSFHVNGDQSGTNKSKFTYRPFTLEGNFACAAGIQEMLLQSHGGVVRIYPSAPSYWREAAFNSLRAEGAFLISAEMNKGMTTMIKIVAEKGGEVMLENPFRGRRVTVTGISIEGKKFDQEFIRLKTTPKAVITLKTSSTK
ncbi:MAG: hypothetical protein V1799_21890 [bacterium]